MSQQNIIGVLTGTVLLLVVVLLIGANSYENSLRRERSTALALELERGSKSDLIGKYAKDQAGAREDLATAWNRFLEMEAVKIDYEDRLDRMSLTCDKPAPPPAFGKAKTPAPSPPGATAWAQ